VGIERAGAKRSESIRVVTRSRLADALLRARDSLLQDRAKRIVASRPTIANADPCTAKSSISS